MSTHSSSGTHPGQRGRHQAKNNRDFSRIPSQHEATFRRAASGRAGIHPVVPVCLAIRTLAQPSMEGYVGPTPSVTVSSILPASVTCGASQPMNHLDHPGSRYQPRCPLPALGANGRDRGIQRHAS